MSLRKLSFLSATGLLFFVSSCRKDNYVAPAQTSTYQTIFDDEFNDNTNNWAAYDQNNGLNIFIQGGALNYQYFPASANSNSRVVKNVGLNTNANFIIQSGIETDNQMGITFGVSNSDNGFAFFVDNSGNFALYDEGINGNAPQAIINWQHNSIIKTGALNNMEFDQVGSSWYGYINGTQVFQISAQSIGGSQVGFVVNANTDGLADYLTVQQ